MLMGNELQKFMRLKLDVFEDTCQQQCAFTKTWHFLDLRQIQEGLYCIRIDNFEIGIQYIRESRKMPNMTWSDQSMHMIMLGNLSKLNDRIPEEDEKEERRLMNF